MTVRTPPTVAATYTLPQWTTSGPAGFGYGLTFSGNNTVISSAGAPSNNWGMNFVYVPAGSTNNAGTGGGGISGAGNSANAANKNFAMSMWVNWNGTQVQATHVGSGGTVVASVTGANSSYGQPICWNAASAFSNVEIGLNGPSPTGAKMVASTSTATATLLGPTSPGSGWNNIVFAGVNSGSTTTWTMYLNGTPQTSSPALTGAST